MKETELNIRIAKIRELSDRNGINRWELMKYDRSGITVTLESKFHARPARHCVSLIVGTHYRYMRNQLRHDLLQFYIEVFFDIEPFNMLASEAKGDIELPPRIMTIMYGAAIGALRGILAQKLENTQLRDYPLPLVNVSELVSRHIYGTPAPDRTVPFADFRYS